MSKYWSLLAALGGMAATAFTPAIQGALSAHPTATAVIGGTLAVIAHWLPSPAQK